MSTLDKARSSSDKLRPSQRRYLSMIYMLACQNPLCYLQRHSQSCSKFTLCLSQRTGTFKVLHKGSMEHAPRRVLDITHAQNKGQVTPDSAGFTSPTPALSAPRTLQASATLGARRVRCRGCTVHFGTETRAPVRTDAPASTFRTMSRDECQPATR